MYNLIFSKSQYHHSPVGRTLIIPRRSHGNFIQSLNSETVTVPFQKGLQENKGSKSSTTHASLKYNISKYVLDKVMHMDNKCTSCSLKQAFYLDTDWHTHTHIHTSTPQHTHSLRFRICTSKLWYLLTYNLSEVVNANYFYLCHLSLLICFENAHKMIKEIII